MKKFFILLPLLLAWLLPAAAPAQSLVITATITVTNIAGTTNGQTITVNSDTRTWTNSVSFPLTQILTNNNIGGCATNLYNAAAAAPFANLSLGQLTNGITLQTVPNGAMNVSLSPGWGLVVLTTNTLTLEIVVRVPISVETAANQTNIATLLAQALESSTYGISVGAPVLSNMMNLALSQTISGFKKFLNAWTTNETNWSGYFSNPSLTSGINYGNSFSSPSTNASSEQFGFSALALTPGSEAWGDASSASGSGALAVGGSSIATGANSFAGGSSSTANGPNTTALGTFSSASGQNATANGEGAIAGADFATALGTQSNAGGTNSTAVGQGANAGYLNSTAIGKGATATGTNQIQMGTSSTYVNFPGNASHQGFDSNVTFAATNTFPAGSDIAFGRFALTTLANGNNAGVVAGTNIFVEVSGPTGAFNVNGIAGGRDGKFLILLNRTGQNMTIAHDSGVDPTSANRIYCLTGADKTVTGNSAAQLIYSAAVSRWVLLNFTQ